MGDRQEDGNHAIDLLTAFREVQAQDVNDDDEMVIVTDWKVKSDGRLTIPKDKRDKYDIEEGEDVDAILMVRR